MSGGIEDWHHEQRIAVQDIEQTEDKASNIVSVTFNKKELTQQKILEKIKEMQFDKLVLIGTKDGDIYAAHSGVDDIVKLVGLFEMVKINCMLEKV